MAEASGTIEHVVAQGDCISSIAAQYGFFWETLWNHTGNSSLKNLRKDPNALLPGDIVTIPERQEKQVSAAADARHTFKVKGVPAKVKIRLTIDDQPVRNTQCDIEIDGISAKPLSTDGDGYLKFSISPLAQKVVIMCDVDDIRRRYELSLGHVDPLDTQSGQSARLFNLGYDTTDFATAVRCFQADMKLEQTGTMNQATQDKLKERFGQ